MSDPEDPEELEEVTAEAVDDDEAPRIAHYLIQGVVARGHESVVYRAKDETLGRGVALKVMGGTLAAAEPGESPAHESATEEAADRLIDEARVTSQLSHPGIAAVYQAGRDEASGCAFVAFEWVDGATLRAHLRRGELELADLLRFAAEIASAVAHAHEQQLVHGDLKLDNVVLPYSGPGLKLIDFGLSSAIERFTEGEIWGTPAYMAPELFDGAPRTIESDLFALGVLLYELATRMLPFGGEDENEHAVAARLRADQREPLDQVRPGLPTEFVALVDQLLERDPQRRGPTASQAAQILLALGPGSGRRGSGRRTAVFLILLVVCGAALATRSTWWSWFETPSIDRGETANRPIEMEVAPWPSHRLELGAVQLATDPQGVAPSEEAERFRLRLEQTLSLFLSPRDPGSSLLAGDDGQGSVASIPADGEPIAWIGVTVQASSGAAFEVTVRLTSDREARRPFIDAPPLEGAQDHLELRAEEGVAAALEAIRKLRALDADSEANPRPDPSAPSVDNPPAQTSPAQVWSWRHDWPVSLSIKPEPIRAFIEGVERSRSIDTWEGALDAFERAQAGGSFLEAKAWRAAVLFASERTDEAAALAVELRDALLSRRLSGSDRTEPLACVIETLGRPTVDRNRRWGAAHPLALAFDDGLDARDPALTDGELRARFADGRRSSRGLLYRQAQLFVRTGDLGPAREAYEAYVHAGSTLAAGHEGWRESFLEWRLDHANSTQEMKELKLMRWLLPRSRQTAYHLVMPLVMSSLDAPLERSRRDELAAIEDRAYGIVEAEILRCVRWMLLGDLPGAREIAAPLSPPLDRGLGGRLTAAIEILAGRPAEARAALERARVQDPAHPGILFLEQYVETSPYELSPEPGPESDYRRWRRGFALLAQARAARERDEPKVALELLEPIRWVDSEYRVLDWPELGFLAWLEQVEGLRDLGRTDEAKGEFERFRNWWPADRAPESRVGTEAKRVEVELDGAQ